MKGGESYKVVLTLSEIFPHKHFQSGMDEIVEMDFEKLKVVLNWSTETAVWVSPQLLHTVKLLQEALPAGATKGLEHLPIELQRNFTLMRDLDTRAQSVMRNIDEMADDFMVNLKAMSSEKKKEKMSEIQQQFNKAKEYGDDKVQLAIQTYELVDKHIRRLDSDLARFESEIHDKVLSTTRTQEEQIATKRGRNKKVKEKEKKKKVASSEEESVPKATTKRKKKSTTGSASSSVRQTKGEESPSLGTEVLDMPVDPNEPTYCLCHQVSYGEMIGCDNPDCPIEWFHFACVGLTIKPKGKWFCPKCSADRKKK